MDKKKKLQKHSKHHSKKHMKEMKTDMKKGDSFAKAHKKALKKVGKQWLKNLNHFKQEINLKKEAHGNTKKIKISRKNVKKNRLATKDRVDKRPLISYIERMKGRNMKTVTINVSGASQSQWSTFLLELNLMKKAWKRYGVDAELKAKSLTKIINLGTTYGEANRRLRQDSKQVQQNKR